MLRKAGWEANGRECPKKTSRDENLNRFAILEKKIILAMSMLPSLSVWSSVKFPFPKYSPESKIRKPYSVESCDDFIRRNYEKSRAERASEMVNLRVPSNVNVDKENSVPNLYCKCTGIQKKPPKSKKKNRHIRFVTVPEIIFYEKESAILTEKFPDAQNANFQNFEAHESGSIPGETEEEYKPARFEERLDEIGSIPSVKPWTLEELVEMKRQREEARDQTETKKNKRRGNVRRNHVRVLKTANEVFRSEKNVTFVRNFGQRDSFIDFTEEYYRCELYYSKLGLNSGYTEKVHKIQWRRTE